MKKIRVRLAWVLLLGGSTGFILSALGLLAPEEPRFVLLLSWGAIVIEGFNGVQIAHDACD
jgi:hypothetical protein